MQETDLYLGPTSRRLYRIFHHLFIRKHCLRCCGHCYHLCKRHLHVHVHYHHECRLLLASRGGWGSIAFTGRFVLFRYFILDARLSSHVFTESFIDGCWQEERAILRLRGRFALAVDGWWWVHHLLPLWRF